MQFAKIVGQRNLINTLIDVVLNNRVSHAQLFLGNAGYGGFALALAYAQFVSCTDKQVFASSNKDGLKADSCGKCPSCLKYEKLSHPDLFFTFPNTTTKAVDKNNESASFLDTFRNYVFSKNAYIDLESWYQELGVENKQGAINVRDANTIIKNLTLKTYESQYKINIVWGVDKLQIDAANKLLKILEEPYENTLFLLVAESSELLLPTILSRTQLIKLPPILDEDLAEYLSQENDDNVEEMVRVAEGNLIKALSYNSDEKQEYRKLFIQFNRLAFSYNNSLSEIYKLVEKICKMGREELKVYLNYSLELYRECFQQKELNKQELCNFTEEEKDFKTNFSRFITPRNILNIYNLTQKSMVEIMRNGNAKMIFLTLAINIGKLIKNTPNK